MHLQACLNPKQKVPRQLLLQLLQQLEPSLARQSQEHLQVLLQLVLLRLLLLLLHMPGQGQRRIVLCMLVMLSHPGE